MQSKDAKSIFRIFKIPNNAKNAPNSPEITKNVHEDGLSMIAFGSMVGATRGFKERVT